MRSLSPLPPSPPLSLFPSLTHTHALSLSLIPTHTHTHSLAHALSLSFSLALTHTHSHTLAHIHTHTRAPLLEAAVATYQRERHLDALADLLERA